MRFLDNIDYWKDALEQIVTCPVCAGSDLRPGYTGLLDELENLPGKWEMLHCNNCNCFVLSPRPKQQSIEKAYFTYYTHSVKVGAEPGDNGETLLWRLANGYLNKRYKTQRVPVSDFGANLIPLLPPLRHQLDFYMRHLPANVGRLLDVGCGNGAFLARALGAGWSVLGLDPDPLAVKAAQDIGVPAQQGTLDTLPSDLLDSFDYITASNVIEHIHEPTLFVQRIFEALRPGGTIWLATPNVEGVGHRWFGDSWRGLEPPRHMVLFNCSALRQLLVQSGFVDVRFQCRGRGARYILKASADTARQRGKRIFPLPVAAVDLLASVFASGGEEVVVTARKPSK